MSFQEKTLTILVAPSGAGKSTFISNLRRTIDFAHVDRDTITEGLLDSLPKELFATPHFMQELEARISELCLNELFAAFENGENSIVVDYPSQEGDRWLETAMKFGRQFGYHIDLRGIYADPALTAEETINRNAIKMGGIRQNNIDWYLDQNEMQAGRWIIMYQHFPKAFDTLLQSSDSASLHHRFSGCGDRLPIIAEWPRGNDGSKIIYDSMAYSDFCALRAINPNNTRLNIAFKRGSNDTFDFEVELRGHLPHSSLKLN